MPPTPAAHVQPDSTLILLLLALFAIPTAILAQALLSTANLVE